MDRDRFSHETARVGEFRRRMVRHVLCHSCGYEPPRGLGHTRCPKCGGGCWERFVQMGKLRADPPACRTAMTRPRSQSVAAPATADASLAG
jgi:hypothetical protein